jgi:hypothetical protein
MTKLTLKSLPTFSETLNEFDCKLTGPHENRKIFVGWVSTVALLDLDGSLSLAAVGTACGGILERCNILGIISPHRRSGGQALDRSHQVTCAIREMQRVAPTQPSNNNCPRAIPFLRC